MAGKRLSARQLHVLRRMAEGWELAQSSIPNYHCWLQQNGIGRGGPSEIVHGATMYSLITRGFVRQSRREWPDEHYTLTAAGRAVVEAAYAKA